MIRPRSTETAAIAAVLASEDYDTPEAMSKDLVKVLAGELEKRECYVVARTLPGEDLWIPHGPVWTKGEADRLARQWAELGFAVDVRNVFPVAGLTPRVDIPASQVRCTCGHRKELHATHGCAVWKRNPRRLCECSTYEEK